MPIKRKLTVRHIGNETIRIELSPVTPGMDIVDVLREIRDRLIEQVGASEKGKVSLGKILSQQIKK